jgi:hypothetical protein
MDSSGAPGSIARSSSFIQQGTVDWGNLASKFVSYTIEVLTRLSSANIQPLTVEVASLTCCQFNISPAGRVNVSQALSSLTYHKAFGNVLWFGFGVRHIVHTLAITNGGFSSLALCAALSEYYPEHISAEVLNELAKSIGAPTRLTPSIMQWGALMKSCAGVFAATQFPVLVGQFQRLVESHYPTGTTIEPDQQSSTCAMPKTIAEALRGIGSVSRGEMAAISIVGGRDIFWLAAVCQWLFSLEICIRSTEGTVLYSDKSDNEEPRVALVLHYQSDGSPTSTPYTQSLQSIRKTYVLENTRSLIQHGSEGQVFSGRAPWDSLFGSVFGLDFDELVRDQEQSLGTAIGSAARILLGLATVEEGIPKQVYNAWPTYSTSSFGNGFITQLVDRFPELARMKGIMNSAARTSFKDAKIAYENQVKILIMQCGCRWCSPGMGKPVDYEHFCRVAIFETIVALAYMLAEVEIAPNLFLKIASVRATYRRQMAYRQAVTKQTRRDVEGDDEDASWYDVLGPFALIVGDVYDKGTDHHMMRCMTLFSGSSTMLDGAVAVSGDGICCYRGILKDGPSDESDECLSIHVLSGTIEHDEKPFSLISDDRNERYQVPKSSLQQVGSYTEAKIYLTETLQELRIYFLLLSPENPAIEPIKILPTKLMKAITTTRGWVKCLDVDCRKVCEIPEGDNITLDFVGNQVHVIKADKLARCAALTLATLQGSVCLLRKDECVQCCLRVSAGGNLSKYFNWGSPYSSDYSPPMSNSLVLVSALGLP